MKTLRFNKQRFLANDPKARELTKQFLKKELKVDYFDNPDPYGVDLLSLDNGAAEVEHRKNWQNGDFPFLEVNVPYRKFKYFDNSKGVYCVWSYDYSRIGICPFDKIINSPVKENKNCYISKEEYFFVVPVGEFQFFEAVSLLN